MAYTIGDDNGVWHIPHVKKIVRDAAALCFITYISIKMLFIFAAFILV